MWGRKIARRKGRKEGCTDEQKERGKRLKWGGGLDKMQEGKQMDERAAADTDPVVPGDLGKLCQRHSFLLLLLLSCDESIFAMTGCEAATEFCRKLNF